MASASKTGCRRSARPWRRECNEAPALTRSLTQAAREDLLATDRPRFFGGARPCTPRKTATDRRLRQADLHWGGERQPGRG